MEGLEETSAAEPNRQPLTGDKGQLIAASPCGRYEIRRAEISDFPADAIVNATNRWMSPSTLAMAGWSHLQIIIGAGNELSTWMYDKLEEHPGGLDVGEAIASPGFELQNCHYIIHSNGPIYRLAPDKPIQLLKQQLADCYRRCLEEALKVGAKEIAFPCIISNGVGRGWPKAEAAEIAIRTVRSWFNHPLHKQQRKEKIPGPIYFLTDPMGSADQEYACLHGFSMIWPEIEIPQKPHPISRRTSETGSTSRSHNLSPRQAIRARIMKEFDDYEEGEVDEGPEAPRKRRRLSLSKIDTSNVIEFMLDEEEAEEKERSRSKSPRTRDGKE